MHSTCFGSIDLMPSPFLRKVCVLLHVFVASSNGNSRCLSMFREVAMWISSQLIMATIYDRDSKLGDTIVKLSTLPIAVCSDVSRNSLSGSLPPSLGGAQSLTYLWVLHSYTLSLQSRSLLHDLSNVWTKKKECGSPTLVTCEGAYAKNCANS